MISMGLEIHILKPILISRAGALLQKVGKYLAQLKMSYTVN